jgi:ElaB/YqjD/DUF883 family membrane-anchored ribosome-binding protein
MKAQMTQPTSPVREIPVDPILSTPSSPSETRPSDNPQTSTTAQLPSRVEYQQKLNEEVDKLNASINEFFMNVSESTQVELPPEHHQLLQHLMEQRDILQQKRDDFEKASATAWEDLQNGLEHSVQQLQESFSKALSRFSE